MSTENQPESQPEKQSEKQDVSVTKTKVLKSFSWSYAEKLSLQLVSFFLSIILARLLTPADYGKLALVNIFITIVSAATMTGFGSALIQKKHATDKDYSSTLIFSFGIALVAYIVLFVLAPALSMLMEEDITSYLRVAALGLVIGSVNTVLHAYAIRRMQFYKLFIASMVSVIVSACVGIFMAYNGYGVWALVAQHLSSSITNMIVFLFIGGWHPRAEFSLRSVKETYSFAWKLIVSSVMDALYRQLRSLAIGKKYTSTDLAFYDRGNQYPALIINNVDTSIASVLAPALARKQDDLDGLRRMVRRGVKTSSVVLFPLLIGLAVCAEPIVLLMLTEKWLPCVPYLQVLSLAMMFKPIQTANLQGIVAMGKSGAYLKIQMLHKLVGVAVIAITIFCFDSVFIIAVGELVAYMLFACINTYPNTKYLKYGVVTQLGDVLPSLVVAGLMGVLVYLVGFLQIALLLRLVLQVLVGMVFYIVVMRLLRVDAFMYLWNMMMGFLKKLKKRGH